MLVKIDRPLFTNKPFSPFLSFTICGGDQGDQIIEFIVEGMASQSPDTLASRLQFIIRF